MKIRFVTTTVVMAALAAGACGQEGAEAPPKAVAPSPATAATAAAPAIGYACESGETISVRYADVQTARLTYKAQTYDLRTAQSASGARYAGSGVEWWIISRDGQENATLSRLGPNQDVGVAVMERCGRPASGPATPAGPTPAPSPAEALPAAAPCRGPQLRLSNDGGDAGAGNRSTTLGVTNAGPQPCSLTGYPTVALLDAQGRALTAIRTDQTPSGAPTPVMLAPQAKAVFDLAHNVVPNAGAGERVCPAVARIRVTAPGDTAPLTLALAFTPCGGRIQVGPFRPAGPTVAPTPAATRP